MTYFYCLTFTTVGKLYYVPCSNGRAIRVYTGSLWWNYPLGADRWRHPVHSNKKVLDHRPDRLVSHPFSPTFGQRPPCITLSGSGMSIFRILILRPSGSPSGIGQGYTKRTEWIEKLFGTISLVPAYTPLYISPSTILATTYCEYELHRSIVVENKECRAGLLSEHDPHWG